MRGELDVLGWEHAADVPDIDVAAFAPVPTAGVLAFAGVCLRMLTCADVCWRMLTCADVC